MSRRRSAASLRSCAAPASTSSAIRRSLNSPIEKYYASSLTSASGRDEIKRQCQDEIDREELQPLHPVALAVHDDDDRGEHRQGDRRNLEPIDNNGHRRTKGDQVEN